MTSLTCIRVPYRVVDLNSQNNSQTRRIQSRASSNVEWLFGHIDKGALLINARLELYKQGPGRPADLSLQASRVSGTSISDTARDMATATLGRLVIDSLKEDDSTEAKTSQAGKLLKINLDLWLWQANQLRKTKNSESISRAIKMYEYCIERDSTDGRAYACLARIKEQQRDIKNARAVLEEGVAATKGECVKVWQSWAMLEYRQGDITKARTLFDAATFARSTYAAAWHAWAQMEESAGNLEKAMELLKRGLRNVPNSTFILRSLGSIQAKLGDYEEARETFRYGLKLNPTAPALWLSWGTLETNRGNFDDAYRILSNGMRSCPQNPNLYVAMASCEKARGRDPVPYLRDALKLEPKHSPTWASLAIAEAKAASELQRKGLFEESEYKREIVRQCYREALKLNPTNISAWQSFGCFEGRIGDHDKARHIFRSGLRNCSRGSPALRLKASSIFHGWAVMEDKNGRGHLAHELLKASLRANVRHHYSWTYWIKICDRDDRLEQASLVRKCKQRYSDSGPLGSTEIASLHSGLLRPSKPVREAINEFLNKRPIRKTGGPSLWKYCYNESIDDMVYQSIGRWILAAEKLDKRIDRFTDEELNDYFNASGVQ